METDSEPDYSDFKYQHVQFQHEENGERSARSTFAGGIEPLAQSGGLEINEVAELVAIRVEADVQTDDHGSNSVTEEGIVEFRGVMGANLDSLSDLIDSQGTDLDRFETPLESNDNADGQLRTYGHDKEEVFYHFLTAAYNAFSSDAGGVGGAGGFNTSKETINFRDLVGRGPVLDSNDNISVVSRVIKNNVLTDIEAHLRATLVWDIATVDEAGARFSVPM